MAFAMYTKGQLADVKKARAEHPGALLMTHPECRLEVLEISDHVTSTSGMLRFAKTSPGKEFIVGTEVFFVMTYKVNGETKTEIIEGAQPINEFQQKIEAALLIADK